MSESKRAKLIELVLIPVIVGSILLVIEYKTGLFAELVSSQPHEPTPVIATPYPTVELTNSLFVVTATPNVISLSTLISSFKSEPVATNTPTRTPNVRASLTTEAQLRATAIAATLTALPTDTLIPTKASIQIAPSTATPTSHSSNTPTPTLVPTNTPRCVVLGQFASLWSNYSNRLGCSITDVITSAITSEEFQKGYFIWVKYSDKIYSLPNGGAWQQHNNPWTAAEDAYSCDRARQYGFPIMGFGKIWCNSFEIMQNLGDPVSSEKPNEYAQQQIFEGGFIFKIYGGYTLVLFDDGTWLKY